MISSLSFPRRRESAFTLIELLVVIAIIGDPDRSVALARRAEGARSAAPHEVSEQPQAARPGHAQLPRQLTRSFPPGRGAGPFGPNPGTNWESWWILSVSYQALAYYEQGNVYELFEAAEKPDKDRDVGQRRRPRENAAVGLYLPVVSVVSQRLSGDELPLVHGQHDRVRRVQHRVERAEWGHRPRRGEADDRDHRWHVQHHPGQ